MERRSAYILLTDRFSDGREATPLLFDPNNRTAVLPCPSWRWENRANFGATRWQGGTVNGICSNLHYLQGLGITTIWAGSVFKQRGHLDTYHGYGVQEAHARGLRAYWTD